MYKNYDCKNIDQVVKILKQKKIKGLNVTIPYKEKIIPYLNDISKEAKDIMAVNTICFGEEGELLGHNTDCYGFKNHYLRTLKKT